MQNEETLTTVQEHSAPGIASADLVDNVKKHGRSEQTLGLYYTIYSALSYTVSLSALRVLTDYNEVSSDWSITIKELTTVLCVTPFILARVARSKYLWPKFKVVALLTLAGFLCQAVGARPHLKAYDLIGIALATPLIQALGLIFSSLFGAFWLKERVTPMKFCALVILVVAVWVLSCSSPNQVDVTSNRRLLFGLGCVASTALGYSSQLSIMRRVLRTKASENKITRQKTDFAPTSLAMVVVTGVGALICGACFTASHGVHAWIEPPPQCWGLVLTAGVANMIGFYFQIESLRRLFVLKQTMIANVQTVTLTLFGLVFMHEPFKWTTFLGVALVVVGVALAGFAKES